MDLRVLLFKDQEHWIAQLLEFHITAQGETTEDAIYELSRLISGEMVMRKKGMLQPLDDIPRAPHKYWEWYEMATPSEHSLIPFEEQSDKLIGTLTIQCREVACREVAA